MGAVDNIHVRIEEAPENHSIARMWQELESSCDASFFQSWAWIGTWLESLPASVQPWLMIAEAGQEIAGLAILVPGKLRRHLAFTSRALFLQEAGLSQYDFTVEYNGFLLKSGVEAKVITECLRVLLANDDWDELFISGIRTDSPLFDPAVLNQPGLHHRLLKSSASRYVNLAELRLTARDYLSTLSSNTRQQIRRAIRKYEETGPLDLRLAGTLEEAHQYFDQLKVLHQAYWTEKGFPGSFARETWERFHRALINKRFSYGEIQLLMITVGDEIVGCLYNFVRNGWVYAIQSGFRYQANNALHPGYISHYLAIEHNLRQGEKLYNFLAGEARYKSSLSQNEHHLAWIVLQRKRLKFKLENFLRTASTSIRRRRRAGKDN